VQSGIACREWQGGRSLPLDPALSLSSIKLVAGEGEKGLLTSDRRKRTRSSSWRVEVESGRRMRDRFSAPSDSVNRPRRNNTMPRL
jgi:hypothetical protein